MKKSITRILVFTMMLVLITLLSISQNIPCKENSEKYDHGHLKSCILSANYTIDGYVIPENSSIAFNKKGALDYVKLGKDAKMLNQLFPAKTQIFFNHWIGPFSFWPSKQMEIQGHILVSRWDGIGNAMFANGRLSAIWLANDETIEGIPCTSSVNIFKYGFSVISKGTNRMVFFHENGKLQQAMLSKDIIIQGKSFKKGDLVRFDEFGKLVAMPK